jgi:transcriptional regulator GlxA family with amidase domain
VIGHWPDRIGQWRSCHSREPTRRATITVMRIEILLFDGFDDLDAFGPFEVLAEAGLDTRFVTMEPAERVASSHGAHVIPHGVLGDPDLVLVPGGGWHDRTGPGAYAEARRGVITRALVERHERGGRIASVCTGAMLLAEAGLLHGRPAVTHHSALDDLRGFGADVREGERVVDDGDILTAAGVTSGIDLALYLVEHEVGPDAARNGAKEIEWLQTNAASAAG